MGEWDAAGKARAARRPPCGLCGDAILHGYVCVFLHQVNPRWMIHSCAFARNYTKELLRLKDTFYQFFYQFFWGSPSRFSRARDARAAPSGSWFAAKLPARQMCRAFVVARRDYLNSTANLTSLFKTRLFIIANPHTLTFQHPCGGMRGSTNHLRF